QHQAGDDLDHVLHLRPDLAHQGENGEADCSQQDRAPEDYPVQPPDGVHSFARLKDGFDIGHMPTTLGAASSFPGGSIWLECRQPKRPGDAPMIDLYYWPTPNGFKISIMLEECGLPYKIVPVNIGTGE